MFQPSGLFAARVDLQGSTLVFVSFSEKGYLPFYFLLSSAAYDALIVNVGTSCPFYGRR